MGQRTQCRKCGAGVNYLRMEPVGRVLHPMPDYRSPVRTSPGYRLYCRHCWGWGIYGYIEEDALIEVPEGAVCEIKAILPGTRRSTKSFVRRNEQEPR